MTERKQGLIVESDFMGVDTVKIRIEADRVIACDVLEEDVLKITASSPCVLWVFFISLRHL